MNTATGKQLDYINSLIAQGAKDAALINNDYGKFLQDFWSKVVAPENASTGEASDIIDVLKRGPMTIARELASAIKNGKGDARIVLFAKFNKPATKFMRNALQNGGLL